MIAVKFALAIPALATLTLGAVDLHSVHSSKLRLQGIADAAALAGAGELGVAMDDAGPETRAKDWADSRIADWEGAPATSVATDVIELPDGVRAIKVRIESHRQSFFGNLLPPGGWRMNAEAVATSVGLTPLCVLAHGARGRLAMDVRDHGRITAPACMVHSNKEIRVQGRVAAAAVQSVDWARGNISPAPSTGAARIEDPFEGLALSPLRSGTLCTDLRVQNFTNGRHYLPAGIHCGVIMVSGNAEVILRPGDHWIMMGALIVKDDARLTGSDVALLFDAASTFQFTESSEVSLDGRKSGTFAGFVMAASRLNVKDFLISSDQVEKLLGVLYVPEARLIVEGSADVARESAWTVIVAKSLELRGSPSLFINANYDGSNVPVPQGVGPRQGGSRLIQ